jgi:hypothetical protein
MNGFTDYEKRQVIPHAERIVKELRYISTYDEEFIKAISGTGTDSTLKVRKKFEIWLRILDNILKSPINEPRAFPKQLKEQLFETNPICAICKQPILDIDDAEVDHIHCYSKGGATIPSNARLTHRFCNRQKGASEPAVITQIIPSQPILQNQEQNIKELQYVAQPLDNVNHPSIDRIQQPLPISHTSIKELQTQGSKNVQPSRKLFKAKITRTYGAVSRKHYYFPMLEYLFQHGPIKKNKQAYKIIEDQFKDEFTDIDTNNLEQDPSIRWKKNLDWAKHDLRDNGLLRNDIPSVWESTDAGKEFYLIVKDNPDRIETKKEGTRDIITFDNRDIRDIINFDKK